MAGRFDDATITAGMKVRAERRGRLFQLGIVIQILLGPPAWPRASSQRR